MVKRQIQGIRRNPEALAPEITIRNTVRKVTFLPNCKLLGLDPQRLKSRLHPLPEFPISPAEFATQQCQRPAVTDDVVHHQHHSDPTTFKRLNQNADQRSGCQIKRLLHPRNSVASERSLIHRFLSHNKGHDNRLQHAQPGLPFHLNETRPQTLVPINEALKRLPQTLQIHRPFKNAGHRHVIR
ncbi:MAG: hypothetical protein BWY82_02033 [Verrucomicrobia bacterium ADurb.Bin474]|nr:MAG: hypothetical protein BWY82_02033 [Verrucomicrobia bacterium ADurb.Bin474]